LGKGTINIKEEGVTAVLIDKFGEVKWKDGAWSVNAVRELDKTG